MKLWFKWWQWIHTWLQKECREKAPRSKKRIQPSQTMHTNNRQLSSFRQTLKLKTNKQNTTTTKQFKHNQTQLKTNLKNPIMSKSVPITGLTLPTSAIPAPKSLAQTCKCSVLCTWCKFHFTRWAKLSRMGMKLKPCLYSLGFHAPPELQHSSQGHSFQIFLLLISHDCGSCVFAETNSFAGNASFWTTKKCSHTSHCLE